MENNDESVTETYHEPLYIPDNPEDNLKADQEESVIESDNKNDDTHTIDDVDALFLCYAKTFKKLPYKLQTMLKLDIAKLFSRYEMKEEICSKESTQKSKKRPAATPLSPKPLPKKSAKISPSSVQNSMSTQNSKSVSLKHEIVTDVISTNIVKRNEPERVKVKIKIPDQTLHMEPDDTEVADTAVAADVAAIYSDIDLPPDIEPVTSMRDSLIFGSTDFIFW